MSKHDTEWDSSDKSDTELTEIILYHMFSYLDMKLTLRGYEMALVYRFDLSVQLCEVVQK